MVSENSPSSPVTAVDDTTAPDSTSIAWTCTPLSFCSSSDTRLTTVPSSVQARLRSPWQGVSRSDGYSIAMGQT
ncbi:MAG: hypothetical protein H6721_08540 [Sandaracinus sp.]|nr:hypothetical protein [Sandaracinus sp.]